MTPDEEKARLLAEARRIGFDAAGVAPAELPAVENTRLLRWIAEGRHGTMAWMARLAEARVDPGFLLPGARSMLMVALGYWPGERPAAPADGLVSVYARGRDYHRVMRPMLRRLLVSAEKILPGARGRPFVDSAPVLERAYAERAGLGWRGRSANLIIPGAGSWFFLGGLILDRDLPPDEPAENRCGSCTACVDACPTGAIGNDYQVDGSRCISYLTIEHKGPVAEEKEEGCGGWVFGCDVCQSVCPWNRFARKTGAADLLPRGEIEGLDLDEALRLDEERYERLFEGTAVRRAGWARFREGVLRAARNRERGRGR
ncbi:MAG: tRNA epoxyqueuosine(34) reductase QueG [Candidatus Eisenbacteria bacterium]|nr:tRNA epoxyqueuosine(34) reductase QueG [Candidatus Eisenbacteria bacterium]